MRHHNGRRQTPRLRASPSPRLRLALLGGFEARPGTAPAVVLASKKAQGLLGYLALRPGHAHSREKLTALFWDDSPGEQARHSLSQTLFALRRALARCPSCLTIEGQTIALDARHVDVDVVRFERLVGAGTPVALEEATGLYAGDLLEGVDVREEAFEAWLLTERVRLRERAVEALSKLLATEKSLSQVNGSLRTMKPISSTSTVEVPPMTNEDVTFSPFRIGGQQGNRPRARGHP
jgi:DNA-binding SARP family transcriptional activator